MAHANVALNFNAFLEKTKLKDDGSNYTDWVRNLRIILIAASSWKHRWVPGLLLMQLMTLRTSGRAKLMTTR